MVLKPLPVMAKSSMSYMSKLQITYLHLDLINGLCGNILGLSVVIHLDSLCELIGDDIGEL